MTNIGDARNVPPHSANAGYEGMTETASNNNRILRRAIFGYKPEMLNSFSQKTIDRLSTGTRAIAAFQFWKKFGPLFNSVVDMSAGAGAEMAVASRFMDEVAAYDSDPSCVQMSRESNLLFNVSESAPYGKRDIVVLDPYWGDRYEKESKILCLNEVSWFCDVLRRADPYDPCLVVVKAPKYVKVKWLERVLHVQFNNCNTGYLVISRSKSGLLIPVIEAFKNDPNVKLSIYYPDTVDLLAQVNKYTFENNHAAENMEYCYSLDHKINNRKKVAPPSAPNDEDDDMIDIAIELREERDFWCFGKTSVASVEFANKRKVLDSFESQDNSLLLESEIAEEATNESTLEETSDDVKMEFIEEVVKTSFGLDYVPEMAKPVLNWLRTLDLEGALEALLEFLRKWLPSRFTTFKGFKEDCSIETALEEWDLPSYLIDIVRKLLNGANERLVKLVKELLILVYGGDLWKNFPESVKRLVSLEISELLDFLIQPLRVPDSGTRVFS